MAKMNGQGLEALAVRRATMADADKVRYRVYTSKTEFVAVIAESALMAMRIAGVADPLRIIRDLPTEGVAIAAERMEAGDDGQRVQLATERAPREKNMTTALPTPQAEPQNAAFVPLKLGDLDQKRGRSIRILTAKDWEHLTAPVAEQPPVSPRPASEVEPVAEVALPPAPEPADPDQLSPEQVQALLNE